MAIPAGHRPLPGSERPQIEGSTPLGPVDPTERVTVTVLLRQRPGSPPLPDLDHWQHTRPEKRRFLSPEEFGERHGAAEEELKAVTDYLAGNGLHVRDRHAGAGRVVAEGTAAEINAAFAVTLNKYRVPDHVVRRREPHREGRPFGEHMHIGEHEHRGFDGPVHLPSKLLEVVTAVIGLDNRRLGGHAGIGTGDPPGAALMTPTQVAQRYNFPTSSPAGQTIGLYEAADLGAAYLPSDIATFIGGGTPPNLTDIGLLGNTNNHALVSSANGSAFECTIDVSIPAAVAPGVNINIYFTDHTEQGWDHFFHRAMFPHAGENPPSILSASWVQTFEDDTGTIGNPAITGTLAHNVHRHLRTAAVRGITVLMAIGDWGSNDQVFDTKCHVAYPNADPWVTACGGTILGTSQELTWSDANLPSQFDLYPYCATGGGVSDTFPLPPYQAAVGLLPISKNDGGIRRGVPDVAGMVAMTGFAFAGLTNQWGVGTSAVAPLYAGLVAIINAFLGRNVGFLNPTLYTYGPEICHDIVVGNNDSGNSPDAPFYTADIGWDPCTGWGSINGLRLLSALAPAPIIVTAVADGGEFGEACLGGFVDEILTINNSGFAELLISNIASSSLDFLAPGVASYPLAVSPGGSIEVLLRFRPLAPVPGVKNATITITSNDLFSPHAVHVTGIAGAPRLVLGIADSGNFGNVCRGSFADEPLLVSNSGRCLLSVTGITASSGEFLLPEILSYPIAIAPGDAISLPIRFAPTTLGPTPPGTHLTVLSNDPSGPKSIRVSGNAPPPKLVVTGSTCFGGVCACHKEERTISICNVGDCKLHVTSVAFKRKSRHWKLINNPFPANLHPGSCLAVVIRYKATERYARVCELVIESDDPTTPVKTLELLAHTIWNDCGCKKCCGDCRKGCCDKRHCDPCCCEKCHDDCDDDHDDDHDC
jgi:hypothetical protein